MSGALLFFRAEVSERGSKYAAAAGYLHLQTAQPDEGWNPPSPIR